MQYMYVITADTNICMLSTSDSNVCILFTADSNVFNIKTTWNIKKKLPNIKLLFKVSTIVLY